MAKAFALAEEDVMINGNTAGAWGANDPKFAFDGLRILSTATPVDAAAAALNLAHISSAIQNLDVFGRDKSELLLVVSLREENKLRQLLGINLAVNALGLTGTALPGEIGEHFADLKTRKFGGHPKKGQYRAKSSKKKKGVTTLYESSNFC
jgi:hypothetical protein